MHFFFFYSWLLKTPPFLSVHSVTDTPHTDCVLSTHWEGGGDPRSLSLFLSVFITLFYIPLPLLLLFSVSHSFLSLLSHPFFSLLSCMSACEQDFAHCSSPTCLHGDTGMRARSETGLLEIKLQMLHQCITLPDKQTCVFAWHVYWEWLQSVSVTPQWSVLKGDTERPQTFFCELCLLFMYECCGRFVCRWFYVNRVHLMLCSYLSLMSLWVLRCSVWICSATVSKCAHWLLWSLCVKSLYVYVCVYRCEHLYVFFKCFVASTYIYVPV